MYHFPRLDVRAIVRTVLYTFLFTLVYMFFAGLIVHALIRNGLLTEETVEKSRLFNLVQSVVGTVPDLLAGCLVAAFAKRDELQHGLVVGGFFTIFGGLFFLFPDIEPTSTGDILRLLATIPLTLVGCLVYLRLKKGKPGAGLGDELISPTAAP